jgi:hypothetical protein
LKNKGIAAFQSELPPSRRQTDSYPDIIGVLKQAMADGSEYSWIPVSRSPVEADRVVVRHFRVLKSKIGQNFEVVAYCSVLLICDN